MDNNNNNENPVFEASLRAILQAIDNHFQIQNQAGEVQGPQNIQNQESRHGRVIPQALLNIHRFLMDQQQELARSVRQLHEQLEANREHIAELEQRWVMQDYQMQEVEHLEQQEDVEAGEADDVEDIEDVMEEQEQEPKEDVKDREVVEEGESQKSSNANDN